MICNADNTYLDGIDSPLPPPEHASFFIAPLCLTFPISRRSCFYWCINYYYYFNSN